MKKLLKPFPLFFAGIIIASILTIQSCSPNSMDSDAQKICSNLDKLKVLLPEMIKLSIVSTETDEAKNEVKLKLDSMNNEREVMLFKLEEIRDNHDEDEFKKYLLPNCPSALRLGDTIEMYNDLFIKVWTNRYSSGSM